jgi:hypothetical protein
MFLSLKGSVGRNPMINRVGQKLLQLFGGASAAYSLRNLASNIASVVRVRRGSDNSERDFSAEDVSSGAMTQWVNAQVVPPLDLKALDSDGERTGSVIAAEAAYSLRNLSDSYTGNVVDVRRSSDDAEDSFTAAEVADGTLADWVVGDVADLIDDAQYFNGTNAQVIIPDSADFTFSTSIDVSADVLLTSNAASGIINKGIGTSGSREWSLLITSSNQLQFVVFDESLSTSVNVTTSDFPVNEIFTVRGYYDGSAIYLYVNGVEKAITEGVIAIENLSADIQLGNSLAASRHLQGIVSNVSISVNGNEVAHYKGTGATPWDDTIGSNDGTPSNLVTFTGQGYNGFVSKWYDQSGNDNHATQTTAASQPKIVDAGVLVSRGLDFDGVDDHLDLPSQTLSNEFQVLSVLSVNGTSDEKALLASNVSGNFVRFNAGNTTVNYQFSAGATDTVSLNNPNPLTQNQEYLIGFMRNEADSVSASINGITQTDQEADSNTFTYHTIGIRQNVLDPFNGTIQEIIIYNSDQSDNRTAIESNIGDYYGINLPSGVDTENNEVDGFVETWYDQSGNGNDATQQVSGSQPKIVDAGSLVSLNGATGIDFTFSSSFFTLDSTLSLGVTFSLFSSLKPTNSNARIMSGTSSAPRIDFENASPDVVELVSNNFVEDKKLDLSSSNIIGRQTLFSLTNNNTAVNVFDGGTASSENPVLLAGTFSFRRIGGGARQTIQEIIIYDTDQSANRTAIEANINNQYDIY